MYHEIRYLKALGKIQELKMAGRWSFRQPKKQRGPTIYKTHWDYLLDEMVRDFEALRHNIPKMSLTPSFVA